MKSRNSLLNVDAVSNRASSEANDDESRRNGNAAIDPISEIILKRVTTSDMAAASNVSASSQSQSSTNKLMHGESFQETTSPSSRRHADILPLETVTQTQPTRQNQPLDRRGFFSRLLKSSGRPTDHDEADVSADRREEGWKAGVFEFVPNFPVPPKYIHVRAHRKSKREFNRLFLAQELKINCETDLPSNLSKVSLISEAGSHYNHKHGGKHDSKHAGNSCGAIWCMQFSKDGRYLATAGEDKVIWIWQVISRAKDRDEARGGDQHKDSSSHWSDGEEDRLDPGVCSGKAGAIRKTAHAPVFKCKPIRELYGHTSDVLDLSWSKNNFLLSSSMDKTVRLWHISRRDCLCTFSHSDFVTSIVFHPRDDRFFLSGSLDCKLRLWSIPDKEVAYSRDVPDLITAVAFSPFGTVAIAGCFGGQCLFYETDRLQFRSQIHVRSSRGRNSRGSKITGIETYQLSRTARIKEAFDKDIKLLVSTNDSRIRIYNLHDRSLDLKFKGHENEQSQIKATISDNLKYIISGSEDDRTYIWRIDDSGEHHNKKERQDYEYFHSNKNMVTVAILAPTLTRRILAGSQDPIYDICDPPPLKLRTPDDETLVDEEVDEAGFPVLKPETKKSAHNEGNIIVTADRDGTIKVFRQDCAFGARKTLSEAANSMQRKRLSNLGLSPTHSWRDSFSMGRSRSLRSVSLRGSSPRPPYDFNALSERG